MTNLNTMYGVELHENSDLYSLQWFANNFLTKERGFTNVRIATEKMEPTDLTATKNNKNYGFEIKRRIYLSDQFNDNICPTSKLEDAANYDEYWLISLYADGKMFFNDVKREEPICTALMTTPFGQEREWEKNRSYSRQNVLWDKHHDKFISFPPSELYDQTEIEAAQKKYQFKIQKDMERWNATNSEFSPFV